MILCLISILILSSGEVCAETDLGLDAFCTCLVSILCYNPAILDPLLPILERKQKGLRKRINCHFFNIVKDRSKRSG